MGHGKRVGIWFFAVVFIGLGSAAQAGTPPGAAFLKTSPSARTYALGMTNVVAALGAQAMGANPANLGFMPRRFELLSSYAALAGGAQYQHLSAAFSPASHGLLPFSGLGLSVTRLQIGGLAGADALGNKTGSSFGGGDMALSLGGAALLTEGLSFGVAAKTIQSEIGGYRSRLSLASDLGLAYNLSAFSKPFSLGFSINNVGQGVRFISQTDPLPTTVNLGAAFPVGSAMALVQFTRFVNEQRMEIGAGFEYGLGPVALRLGYQAHDDRGRNLAQQSQSGSARLLGNLSGGIGIRMGSAAKLDYAISQQAVEFGSTQRVALTFQWGAAPVDPSAPSVRGGRNGWRMNSSRSDWHLIYLGE